MTQNFKTPLFVFFATVCTAALGFSQAAHAEIEYQELEVYGHQTASVGEVEVENISSVSDATPGEASIFRTSFEFNYGLANNLEVAAYTDFNGMAGNGMTFEALRVRGRYSFFEKNQMPVDLGIYAELAFPQGEDSKMEGEIRGIIEKDFDRLTVSFNPIIERKLVVTNGLSTDLEFGAGATVGYRLNRLWYPHLDAFGSLSSDDSSDTSDTELMIVPAVDYRVSREVAIGARAGFGLTDATERHLVAVRMEYEF